MYKEDLALNNLQWLICHRKNRSTTSQILTIRRILVGVCAKTLEATILFVDFSNSYDSIQEDGANTSRLRPPQRNHCSHYAP